ncbi:hypothetical protein ASC87_04205 [Rhizobacter sp. Root1221]|nr:hypothetical protein ASC87_04205 [Rhizobacter sp. Root1221]
MSERSDSFVTAPQSTASEQTGRSMVSEHSVVIDIPDVSPRDTIVAALPRHFADVGSAEELEEQEAMEAEYIDWAVGVLQARQDQFGAGAAYTLSEDMKAPLKDAVLPALYEGGRQFISSASRSPVSNAIVAALGPRTSPAGHAVGELTFQLDAASVGGSIGGTAAYAVDAWVLQAMDRRAKLANFPGLKAVDLKALVPDPAPVQLRIVNVIVDGTVQSTKQYWRPASDTSDTSDGPTMTELKNRATSQREALARWQQNLDGKGLAAWFQPGMAGAFNVVRRAVSNSAALTEPLPLFAGSVLASASAGAVSKFTLGMTKALPVVAQTEVDNLMGGTQRANLFAIQQPDPNAPAATWSDAKHLPQFMAGTAREAGDLLMQTFNPRRSWNEIGGQAKDILRTALSSATASITALGTGPLFGTLLRGGSSEPLPGEAPDSGAYLLQQFVQSTMNDFTWNAAKDFMKADSYGLSADLDRHRAQSQQSLLVAAGTARRALPNLLADLHRSVARQSDSALAAVMPAISEALAPPGETDQGIDLTQLKAAKRDLKRAAIGSDPDVRQAHASLLQALNTAIEATEQHEAQRQRWSPSASTSDDSADRSR